MKRKIQIEKMKTVSKNLKRIHSTLQRKFRKTDQKIIDDLKSRLHNFQQKRNEIWKELILGIDGPQFEKMVIKLASHNRTSKNIKRECLSLYRSYSRAVTKSYDICQLLRLVANFL